METARANLDSRKAKAANGASLPQLFPSASVFLQFFFSAHLASRRLSGNSFPKIVAITH